MAALLSALYGAGAQLLTNQGLPLSGGKLTSYFAGTTTLASTWTDKTQVTQNPNPIIADSAGRIPNEVWIQSGSDYKFILSDANNNVIATYDNVPGINLVTGTFSEWLPGPSTATYVNSTTFTIAGNLTTTYQPLRRVQFSLTGGTFYGTVSTSSYNGTTTTTVVVTLDSTGMDSSLTVVNYGFMSATNNSIPALYVLAASPTLTGVPTAPTAALGTSTTQIATTAYAMTMQSPSFSGTPSAPTPVSNVNTTQIATTAWVNTYYAAINGPTFTGVPSAPTPVTNVSTTQISTTAWVNTYFATLASPTFTGVPAAPTAAPGTNTTQLATTAFVAATAFSSALPAQTGNNGKYLTTNGTTASWAALTADMTLAATQTVTGAKTFNDAMLLLAGATSGAATLHAPAVAGSNSNTLPPLSGNLGYLEIPQNSQSANYTCVLSDSGGHIYHPSADTTARTFTIPANASVAYNIGTALTFINDTSGGVISIVINSDTLVLAGAGTTGTRSLAANGMATAVKITATRWMISGTGLT